MCTNGRSIAPAVVGCCLHCPPGRLLRWRAFGWARKGYGGEEWVANRDSDTIFRIGSISKSITVVGLMVLAEEGVLSLDDLAEVLVPEVTQIKGYSDREPFTLKMLASHTSGLDREPNALEPGSSKILNVGHPELWEAKALEGIKTAGWAFEPVRPLGSISWLTRQLLQDSYDCILLFYCLGGRALRGRGGCTATLGTPFLA